MDSQSFVGIVKSFNPLKGWGFIECDQSKAIYGKDIFLLRGELGGFGVSNGDQVTFQVKQGLKGHQASEVKVLSSSPEQQCFFGELKTYNTAKGYGFISGAASEQIYGKDIFVLRSDLNNAAATTGMQVMYKVKTGDRGPVATEVQVISGGAPAPNGLGLVPPAAAAQWGVAPQAWPGVQQQWGAAPGYAAAPAWGMGSVGVIGGALPTRTRTVSENEIFYGTLKSVNEEKGWGHIQCDAMRKMYDKDLFVMRSNLETAGVLVGQEVAFNVAQGMKGPHATNVRPFLQPAPETLFSGSIKSFNDTKGWGFIESEMSKQVFFTDIFLHKRELGGTTVSPGDQVQYSVEIQGGRAVAKNIGVIGAALTQGHTARVSPY